MPIRKYNNARRKTARTYKTTVKKAQASARVIQAAVKRALYKTLETKKSTESPNDGVKIGHNSFISRSNNLLTSTQGTSAPDASASNNRIGYKITLLGLQVKGMMELNERYGNCTIRMFVIRSAKGDIPTFNSLWNNTSTNKMIDTIYIERYSILYLNAS